MTTTPNSADVLAPCPHCGAEAQRITLGPGDGPGNEGGDVITCTRCYASSHVEFGRKENLVSAWNRRTESADDALLPTSRKAETLLALLRSWTDSEFAEAASGEFCEDLKARIEGSLANLLDALSRSRPARDEALEEAAIRRAAAAVQDVWQTYDLPVGPKMFRAMAIAALKGQKP